jgi:hypothetical protein
VSFCEAREILAGDMTTRSNSLCAVCGGPETPDNRLCADGFDERLALHVYCYGTQAAREWWARRRAEDARYARYCRLMARWEEVTCPRCGTTFNMEPKAVGMCAGSWPLNCTECRRIGPKRLSGYRKPMSSGYDRIEVIRHDFVCSRRLDEIDALMRELAAEFDDIIDPDPCGCGGRFSLAARPRCLRCDHVVYETCFNTVHELLTEEQIRRLNAKFGPGWRD